MCHDYCGVINSRINSLFMTLLISDSNFTNYLLRHPVCAQVSLHVDDPSFLIR